MSARTIKKPVFFSSTLAVGSLHACVETGRSGGTEIPFVDAASIPGHQ
jgi:hypothetical protein